MKFGLLSGILWGLDTVFLAIILGNTTFVSSDTAIFLAPFVSTFFHDFFSSLWIFLYLYFSKALRECLKLFKTRAGLIVMGAALLGGPLGMTGYLLAIKMIGAGYTSSISAFYPAFGAFLAFLFLKERLHKLSWFGFTLSVLGIYLLTYVPISGQVENFGLGVFLAFFCVVGWGSECVIISYALKSSQITPIQSLYIRQTTSFMVYLIFIIPIVKGFPLISELVTSPVVLYLLSTALFGTVSYFYYYKAIDTIGATRAIALNSMYAIWSIIFSAIIFQTALSGQMVAYSLLIIIGVILTVTNFSNSRKEYL